MWDWAQCLGELHEQTDVITTAESIRGSSQRSISNPPHWHITTGRIYVANFAYYHQLKNVVIIACYTSLTCFIRTRSSILVSGCYIIYSLHLLCWLVFTSTWHKAGQYGEKNLNFIHKLACRPVCGEFLDGWLIWKGPAYCEYCCSWSDGLLRCIRK